VRFELHTPLIVRIEDGGEDGFEAIEVRAGGGVDDEGPARTYALDFPNAEPHTAESLACLRGAESDVEPVAFSIWFHGGCRNSVTDALHVAYDRGYCGIFPGRGGNELVFFLRLEA